MTPTTEPHRTGSVGRDPDDRQRERVHRWVTLVLQGALLVGAVLALFQGRGLAALATFGIMLTTTLPVVLGRRFHVNVPPEWEALAVVFIYASLFLGEIGGYYVRFWWWDALLHTGSGFLLGLAGFLLVHVLNEQEEIDVHLKPKFVALFAFMFAMGVGALWEIFEFAMDQTFGMNMQKSGLVDTMWDLIVDGVGALVICSFGLAVLRAERRGSFLERWILGFIQANPRLFRRSSRGP